MADALQIIGVNAEDFLKKLAEDREKTVAEMQAKREEPVDFPAEEIMKLMGWKSKRKFYKERQLRGVQPKRVIGTTPTYIPAHFLTPIDR